MHYGIGIPVNDLDRPAVVRSETAPDVTRPLRDSAITPALFDSCREVGKVPGDDREVRHCARRSVKR